MQKKVVVVEDTAVVRELLVTFLQRYACRVLEAADGREGLALVRAEHPDLVLLDISMPEMSGRDVLTLLRGDPDTRDVPVIMTTAQAAKDVVTAVLAQGVNGYLVKPISRELFDREVSKILGEPTREAARRPSATGSSPSSTPVLIGDASGRDIDTMRVALGSRFRVLTATSSREAIQRYRHERPAVTIISLDLRDMGGWQTLATIRQLDAMDAGRYVALVPAGVRPDPPRLRASGFSHHIEKPIDPGDLLRTVITAAASGDMMGWHDDVPVIVFPNLGAAGIDRLSMTVFRIIDRLARDGHDRFLIDLRAVQHLAGQVPHVVTRAIRAAKIQRMRVAAVAAGSLASTLCAREETRVPCAPSLVEAVDVLRGTRRCPQPPPLHYPAT